MPEQITAPVVTPPYLQAIARAFRQPQMVADEVAPVIDADTETGKYTVYGQDDLYTVDNTYSHGSIPNEITSTESEDTYTTQLRVIRHPLLDRDTDPKRPNGRTRERRYTNKVTMATQIAREARVAAAFTNTANYPGTNVLTKAGGAEWDAVGVINTIQPITDIESRIQKIINGALTSRDRIDVVIPAPTFDDSIRYNTAIREYYKYTEKGITTPDLLASFLGVRRVLIATGRFAGSAAENTGNDISTGIPSSNLWGDTVWVGIVDTDDLDLLTFARQFAYKDLTGGQEIQIRKYGMADPGQRGQWIEAGEQRDLKITASFAGAIIVNTHT
jgi:hypothetical protein